jgi:secondary thiamine-phosphate synthase enzyme
MARSAVQRDGHLLTGGAAALHHPMAEPHRRQPGPVLERDHRVERCTLKTLDLTIHTGRRRGLFDLTAESERFVAGEGDGLLNLFAPHATCGLVIVELGSGTEQDLLATLDRLLPRDDHWVHQHGSTGHGADHVLPAFAPPSIVVPVVGGRLALGTWQSIALLDTNVDNETRTVRLSFLTRR